MTLCFGGTGLCVGGGQIVFESGSTGWCRGMEKFILLKCRPGRE